MHLGITLWLSLELREDILCEVLVNRIGHHLELDVVEAVVEVALGRGFAGGAGAVLDEEPVGAADACPPDEVYAVVVAGAAVVEAIRLAPKSWSRALSSPDR